MTKEQVMQKVQELAQTAQADIIADVEYLIANGGVDINNYEDTFKLPQILLTAALRRNSDLFWLPQWNDIISNLEKM